MIDVVQCWHWFWILLMASFCLSILLLVFAFILPKLKFGIVLFESKYLESIIVMSVCANLLLICALLEILIFIGTESINQSVNQASRILVVFFLFGSMMIPLGFTEFIAEWLIYQFEKNILPIL